jgi:hypothetical protein
MDDLKRLCHGVMPAFCLKGGLDALATLKEVLASFESCFLAWIQVIYAAKLAASLRYAVLAW